MIVFIRRSSAVLLLCVFILNLALLATIGGAAPKTESKRILLDAGHGAPDGGCVGADGTQEATLNLEVCLQLKSELEKRGMSVQMTRTSAESISDSGQTAAQKKRSDMHKRKKMRDETVPDLFVSIHMNSFAQTQYHGAQVIYDTHNPQAVQAAHCVQNALRQQTDEENKRMPMAASDSIYLLRAPSVPSILVECGFLSNPEEREKLKTAEYRQKLASAIAQGLDTYFEKSKNGEKIQGSTIELKR